MQPIKIDDLTKYLAVSQLTASGQGQTAAMIVTTVALEKNSYNKNLWLCQNGRLQPLTKTGAIEDFIWDDPDTLLYRDESGEKAPSVPGDTSTFYRMDIATGSCRFAFSLPLGNAKVRKIRDGLYLAEAYLDAQLPDYYKMSASQRLAVEEERSNSAEWQIMDELPFWYNGSGFINKLRHRLFLYEECTKKLEPLTEPLFNTTAYAISRNNSCILICGEYYDEKRPKRASFHIYDLSSGQCRCIDDSKRYFVEEAVAAGDGFIVVGSLYARYGIEENYCLYYVNPADDSISLLADADIYINNSVVSDCRFGETSNLRGTADGMYFITTQATTSQIWKAALDGTITPVVTREGCVDDFDLWGDDIILTGLYDMQPEEIYHYHANTKTMEQISRYHTDLLADKYVAVPQPLTFHNHGLDLDGWVMLPKDYDTSKTYPAILDIHGGPRMTFGPTYYHEMQVWTSAGFFVFYCNPWGSSGRGNEFGDLRGRYGTLDYEDLMAFTDAVLKAYPQIDPARVGVTGGSYGGFMTNWIIGHTDRFAAAATQRSISNWVSFYGYSDIGPYFGVDQQAANIYDGVERMWDHSPLKYADQVTTPTLFIHSDEDYRCGLPEGIQLFTALKDRGVPSRFCLFKGENHGLSRCGRPRNRIKRLEEITSWLTKYTS